MRVGDGQAGVAGEFRLKEGLHHRRHCAAWACEFVLRRRQQEAAVDSQPPADGVSACCSSTSPAWPFFAKNKRRKQLPTFHVQAPGMVILYDCELSLPFVALIALPMDINSSLPQSCPNASTMPFMEWFDWTFRLK